MLIEFRSDAGPSVVLFGEVAQVFLALMGQSGQLPGALKAEDIGRALEGLRAGLPSLPRPAPSTPDEEQAEREGRRERPVAMATRAWPLLQLMEAAIRKQRDLMWGEARNPLI